MTNSAAAYAAPGSSHPVTALRTVGLLGLVSGTALVVDTVTITVLNTSFGVMDSVLFFVGFATMWPTLIALAVHLSAGRRGRGRLRVGVGAFLAVAVAIGAVSWAADTLGRRLFSPANVGLHEEWSFFSIGLCLLVIAGTAARQARHPSEPRVA